MTKLAEIRANNKRLVFREAHSKQDNIWDKQYQHDGRNQTCNLQDYPDRNHAISAWNRGIAKAREMAQRVGIGSGIDLMANNDGDDDDNNDDDNHPNDSGSNAEESNSSDKDKAEESDSDQDDWFKKPFKGYSYKQLFADLITEAEIEDNEIEQKEQPESCANTENTTADILEDTVEDDDDYNGLIFSESQHIFTNELETPCNENGSNDGNIDKGKFQSDIHISSLKVRKYKSSVVRSLVKHGKVSADRLVRVQQSEPISQDLNQSAADVRNLQDRDSFGLFDNIAIESLSTSGKGYEMGQIVRMRRFMNNRKVEYLKPINRKDDKEKDIRFILKMYNEDKEAFCCKPTTITKEIGIGDIITHVNLSQSLMCYKLSLVDCNYLETYFAPLTGPSGIRPETFYTATESDAGNAGRRVQLTMSRSERLRRSITCML